MSFWPHNKGMSKEERREWRKIRERTLFEIRKHRGAQEASGKQSKSHKALLHIVSSSVQSKE